MWIPGKKNYPENIKISKIKTPENIKKTRRFQIESKKIRFVFGDVFPKRHSLWLPYGKRTGGGKSAFWNRVCTEIIFVVTVFIVDGEMHAKGSQDPIIT